MGNNKRNTEKQKQKNYRHQAYWDIRDELHEAEGLLLFGERLVVPASL